MVVDVSLVNFGKKTSRFRWHSPKTNVIHNMLPITDFKVVTDTSQMGTD